jgi:hypothetical protein
VQCRLQLEHLPRRLLANSENGLKSGRKLQPSTTSLHDLELMWEWRCNTTGQRRQFHILMGCTTSSQPSKYSRPIQLDCCTQAFLSSCCLKKSPNIILPRLVSPSPTCSVLKGPMKLKTKTRYQLPPLVTLTSRQHNPRPKVTWLRPHIRRQRWQAGMAAGTVNVLEEGAAVL